MDSPGETGFKSTLFLLAQSKTDIEIRERIFSDTFSGLVVYVDRVPLQGNRMEGILIHDEREKGKSNTLLPGRFSRQESPRSGHYFELSGGDIHRYEPKLQTFQKIKFDTYDLKLRIAKTFAAIEKKLKIGKCQSTIFKKR